jgi:hypothetical protein
MASFDVNSPSWCLMAAREAVKIDAIAGQAHEVFVTTYATDRLAHYRDSGPQRRACVKLRTAKKEPWMGLCEQIRSSIDIFAPAGLPPVMVISNGRAWTNRVLAVSELIAMWRICPDDGE